MYSLKASKSLCIKASAKCINVNVSTFISGQYLYRVLCLVNIFMFFNNISNNNFLNEKSNRECIIRKVEMLHVFKIDHSSV